MNLSAGYSRICNVIVMGSKINRAVVEGLPSAPRSLPTQ